MFHESQTLWLLKNMCYIFCIHWFYPICFIELLDQNELWVSKCCHAHFKTFYLWLWLTNNVIKISTYCTLWYLLYITFFGEKWFTHSVLSPQWHIVQLGTMLGDDEYSKVKFEMLSSTMVGSFEAFNDDKIFSRLQFNEPR